MGITPIPDKDHVGRHVRKRLVQRDGDKVVGCFPQAFKLRDATEGRPAEDYLSASWLEFFGNDRTTQVAKVIRELQTQLELKRKDAVAIGNVGKIRAVGVVRNTKLRVLHEPKPRAQAYAAIRGLRRDDTEILALLAAEAFAEIAEVIFPDSERGSY